MNKNNKENAIEILKNEKEQILQARENIANQMKTLEDKYVDLTKRAANLGNALRKLEN